MSHNNWFKKSQEQRSMSLSNRIADKITSFAGTMTFVYIHVVIFAIWCGTGLFGLDKFPFNFLTMSVSLEAIFLATFVMISQNRQAERDKIQAEHQYQHQEIELQENTKLTREIHDLTEMIHKIISEKGEIGWPGLHK